MLAVTTGESRSSKDILRAARLTFFLLAGLYLGAITVLAGVMPWNHTGVSESPFVSVLRLAKVPAAALLHEFRCSHRRTLRRQRQTLRRLPPVVFHGSFRMGSRKHGQAERLRFASPGIARLFLRHRDRSHHRNWPGRKPSSTSWEPHSPDCSSVGLYHSRHT